MKKILLFAAISLPFSISAEIAIQDGYEIQGRIFSFYYNLKQKEKSL